MSSGRRSANKYRGAEKTCNVVNNFIFYLPAIVLFKMSSSVTSEERVVLNLRNIGPYRSLLSDKLESSFKFRGSVYHIGDVIQYSSMDQEGGPTSEGSPWPEKWIGVLADFERKARGRKVVETVSICWFYSADDVINLIEGRIKYHSLVALENHERFYDWLIQFVEDPRSRVPTLEVETMYVEGLIAPIYVDDVGYYEGAQGHLLLRFDLLWLALKRTGIDKYSGPIQARVRVPNTPMPTRFRAP